MNTNYLIIAIAAIQLIPIAITIKTLHYAHKQFSNMKESLQKHINKDIYIYDAIGNLILAHKEFAIIVFERLVKIEDYTLKTDARTEEMESNNLLKEVSESFDKKRNSPKEKVD